MFVFTSRVRTRVHVRQNISRRSGFSCGLLRSHQARFTPIIRPWWCASVVRICATNRLMHCNSYEGRPCGSSRTMGNICSWSQSEVRIPSAAFLAGAINPSTASQQKRKRAVGAVFEPIFPLARQKCWEPSAAIASRRSRMAVKGACHAQPDRQRTRPDSRSIGLTRSQCLFRCDSSLTTGT